MARTWWQGAGRSQIWSSGHYRAQQGIGQRSAKALALALADHVGQGLKRQMPKSNCPSTILDKSELPVARDLWTRKIAPKQDFDGEGCELCRPGEPARHCGLPALGLARVQARREDDVGSRPRGSSNAACAFARPNPKGRGELRLRWRVDGVLPATAALPARATRSAVLAPCRSSGPRDGIPHPAPWGLHFVSPPRRRPPALPKMKPCLP